jgi:hypothetical protein
MQWLSTGAESRLPLQVQFATAILAVLLLFASAANAHAVAGTISAVTGSVQILRAAGFEPRLSKNHIRGRPKVSIMCAEHSPQNAASCCQRHAREDGPLR